MPAQTTSTPDLDYADTLWRSADALRGQVDAAEYKHVVLGLLFLKYISDAFESRREQLRPELEQGVRRDHAARRLFRHRQQRLSARRNILLRSMPFGVMH